MVGGYVEEIVVNSALVDNNGKQKEKYFLSLRLHVVAWDTQTRNQIMSEKVSASVEGSQFKRFLNRNLEDLDPEDMADVVHHALEKALLRFGQIASKMNWKGRIVRVDGQRVFLETPETRALGIGDSVYVLGRAPGALPDKEAQRWVRVREAGRYKAKVRIVDIQSRNLAVGVPFSVGQVEPWDRVMLYVPEQNADALQ